MIPARATLAEDIAAAFPAASDDTDGLLAVLDGCTTHGVGRRALLVDLARLPAALARRPHLLLVAAALDPLLGHDRARLFRLADGHLVLVWRGGAGAESERATHALSRLFADLPGNDGPPFTLHDLPRDAPAVAAIVAASVAPIAEPAPPADAKPLDIDTLTRLEAALAQADLAPFARRLPICAWPAGQPPRLAWEKRVVALPALFGALAGENLNAAAAPWLWRRLARALDLRMLALLSDPAELAGAGPFALALNVASILSPEFLRFDAALAPSLRGQITLDISPTDLVTDAAAFALARDFAHARGYRILLCDVTRAFVGVFPPAKLEVDFIQLRVGADLLALSKLPDALSPEIVVLGDVRHPSARGWGQRVGIELFQGPAIQPLQRRPLPNGRRQSHAV